MDLGLVLSFIGGAALIKIPPFVYIGLGALAALALVFALRNARRNQKADFSESVAGSAPVLTPASVPETDDDLIAVIAAAVCALGESAGQKLAVKSVRQVNARRQGRSVWAAAGVYENTRPFS